MSGRAPEYGSDLMAEVLRALKVPYASLNPGASFRGLHDSLVNWNGGGPSILTCQHEKVAVGVAHGYAKATGRPMAVILHDLVGLLQSTMGLYYAFCDRVPVLALGGSGPADTSKRRPSIDWYHSANVQGNAVRDYVKWDDEPRSVAAVPESLIRAWNVARSGPAGPVYVSLDADLQEQELDGEIDWLGPGAFPPASPPTGDRDAMAALATALLDAERPVIVAGFAGRDPRCFELLPELADLVGSAVVDTGNRLSMPQPHDLNLTGVSGVVEESDLVLFLDCKDPEPVVTAVDSASRSTVSRLRPGTRLMSLGFSSLGVRGWSHDFGRLLAVSPDVTADTVAALPHLVDVVRTEVARRPPVDAPVGAAWRARLAELGRRQRRRWEEQRNADASLTPLATSTVAGATWDVVRDYDWVLTAGTSRGWARRIWNIDAAYRHPGDSLGTATQIGIALGVALAHRGTGRLVVDLQPDGDLMFDLGSLWVAAYYKIPMLTVMVNNRAYHNDWEHQEVVARQRGRPVENAYVGMEITGPAPDFSAIARAQGWWAEGPIEDPDKAAEVIGRAADVVASTGQPALVDLVTQPK
ncbi:MAG: thiamine pyrophosphate-binding protein [Actinophytocola sp.]|uniref:thiamine pyrophosphate-binding protein n=1 Tax=Actinophytocola sp. TaxID=1872138 RepID=UPI00132968F0|nr:thiamine pyrophosphate-binding protein [Actinophytocola sp.]MPZ86233.1 thiamine pyrophosphate-binding protein [Actinophytocola sp.]